jgi:hypothetical protein
MTTMIMPMMPIFALPWCSVPCIVSIPLELFQFALGGMETGVCTTSSAARTEEIAQLWMGLPVVRE